tara:strand:- start:400 stop:645 length:246 start_codon:yes stop_codon:yes gene_type:complete
MFDPEYKPTSIHVLDIESRIRAIENAMRLRAKLHHIEELASILVESAEEDQLPRKWTGNVADNIREDVAFCLKTLGEIEVE